MQTNLIALVIAISGIADTCIAHDDLGSSTPGLVKERPSSGRYVECSQGYMIPYAQKIPGTEHSIWMEPIPVNKAQGSKTQTDKPKPFAEDQPFWMARYETRHADFKPYMELYNTFRAFEDRKLRQVNTYNEVDAVTAPTVIYDPDYAFEYGVNMQHPVGTMTLFCARQYTKWLSKLTNLQFRLPTEKEWEHACSAGASTTYHFGNDKQELSKFGWHGKNLEVPGYQQVGLLKPNPWGLFDMHGNMAEWVLQPGVTKPNQQILKGGCWEFPPEKCQTDSKLPFDDEAFRDEDPMYPQSSWWLASYESRWVGFRIVRRLNPMPTAEREFAWEPFSQKEAENVTIHIEEGRGVRGIVDASLPQATKLIPKR